MHRQSPPIVSLDVSTGSQRQRLSAFGSSVASVLSRKHWRQSISCAWLRSSGSLSSHAEQWKAGKP